MWPGRGRAGPGRATLVILVGPRRIECGVLAGTGARARWLAESLVELSLGDAGGIASSVDVLSGVLQGAARGTFDEVVAVVADCWLAAVDLPWTAALKDKRTADFHARSQLAGAGFEVDPADALRLDDAPFGEPRLAVAYPAMLLAALARLAGTLNARLASVAPLSVVAWATVRRGRARLQALAVADAGSVLVARSERPGGASPGAVTVRRAEDAGEAFGREVPDLWRRLCLREPRLAEVKEVAVLDLANSDDAWQKTHGLFAAVDLAASCPPHWADVSPRLRLAASAIGLNLALDAAPRTASPTPLRRVALGSAALLAGLVSLDAAQTVLAARSLHAQLARETAASQPAPRRTAWTRDELARVQAVNAAVRSLNLPVSAILRALEPPRDLRILVLGVETMGGASDAPESRVKLVAEAPTTAEMARYVAFVSARRPFTEAYLMRHEFDEAAAERSLRFTIEATWRE